ncbi:hypothetical protein CspeluHIS016_0504220 [Cutaneotrichosporon spelunceum]|uniref:DNA lyase n=1 Tax=Cutaneotrichosporon spelunceum TaxID=1672016 RepID=A0AAD3TXQ1_9TREE|nr:hypothetical protein CspeluHIS016_0504220 [Cutaneotrichosporon spelunceum]
MRLWSLSPALFDRAALVACWREALLAQKVLAGLTRGYTKHPQLLRFRATTDPMAAIGFFLGELQREASSRGYMFNAALITHPSSTSPTIPVTEEQVEYELDWLRDKVRRRDPAWIKVIEDADDKVGRAFAVVPGGIEDWEKVEVSPKEGKGREIKTVAKVARLKSARLVAGTRRSARLASHRLDRAASQG